MPLPAAFLGVFPEVEDDVSGSAQERVGRHLAPVAVLVFGSGRNRNGNGDRQRRCGGTLDCSHGGEGMRVGCAFRREGRSVSLKGLPDRVKSSSDGCYSSFRPPALASA